MSFQNCLEVPRTLQKSLEDVYKLSERSRNFQNSRRFSSYLEGSRTFYTVLDCSISFQNSLEAFRTLQKVLEISRSFHNYLEVSQAVQKLSKASTTLQRVPNSISNQFFLSNRLAESPYQQQKLFLPILGLRQCEKVYSKTLPITEEQVCAGGEPDQDACSGFGGAPLSVKHGDTYYQVSNCRLSSVIFVLLTALCQRSGFCRSDRISAALPACRASTPTRKSTSLGLGTIRRK